VGLAWEPVPGKTSYTRDSELQNAETSAWGRAIVAVLAADTKKGIASAEEVQSRQSASPRSSESGVPSKAEIQGGTKSEPESRRVENARVGEGAAAPKAPSGSDEYDTLLAAAKVLSSPSEYDAVADVVARAREYGHDHSPAEKSSPPTREQMARAVSVFGSKTGVMRAFKERFHPGGTWSIQDISADDLDVLLRDSA
jgi:hypothetical protein